MIYKNIKKFLCILVVLFTFTSCNSNSIENSNLSSDELSTDLAEKNSKEEKVGEKVSGTLYSESLGIDWNYDVYLPYGYDSNNDEGYPVLYMLHGLGGNHTNLLERFDSKQILDKVLEENNKKMIVVFVDGFNSFYINSNGGMNMEDAVVNDLVNFINTNYNTNKVNNAIGGISMGGYGAARLSLKYPEIFSKAILISPSVWYSLEEDSTFKENLHAFQAGDDNWSDSKYESEFPTRFINDEDNNVKFYIRSAKGDGTVPIEDVRRFNKELEDGNIETELIEDGEDKDHNWDYWGSIAEDFYSWALDILN